MPDQYENFRAAVAGSDTLTSRWNMIADAAIESAAREGVVLTRSDCMMLDSIRLHVLTDDEELAINWREEAETKLPAFAQKAESRKFRDALNSANEAEAEKARADIMARSPSERMRIAREGGEAFSGPVTTKRDLSPGERAKVIAKLDAAGISGAERIKRAREAGLE